MVVLYLGDNRFSGNIPPELGNLTDLIWLHLQGNNLTGAIPTTLSNIAGANDFQISHNGLWTDDPALQTFLDSMSPGWDATQTLPPAGLTVASATDRTVWLEWTPISYTSDPGKVEVFSQALGSPVVVSAGSTPTKLESTFPITGLLPGQAYDLSGTALTYPHSSNQNAVLSEMSAAVSASTTNTGCATPTVSISGSSAPYTLSVTSSHTSYLWSTGETASSIVVNPSAPGYYWVRTIGPGSCDEAAVVSPTILFRDTFESGDTSRWWSTAP
jgi:hypothetical protein